MLLILLKKAIKIVDNNINFKDLATERPLITNYLLFPTKSNIQITMYLLCVFPKSQILCYELIGDRKQNVLIYFIMNNILLDILIKDEKKSNRLLYSSGPYWDYKNRRTIYQLKKKNLKNFLYLNQFNVLGVNYRVL